MKANIIIFWGIYYSELILGLVASLSCFSFQRSYNLEAKKSVRTSVPPTFEPRGLGLNHLALPKPQFL